jgi:hypothetical protein
MKFVDPVGGWTYDLIFDPLTGDYFEITGAPPRLEHQRDWLKIGITNELSRLLSRRGKI